MAGSSGSVAPGHHPLEQSSAAVSPPTNSQGQATVCVCGEGEKDSTPAQRGSLPPKGLASESAGEKLVMFY